MKLANTDTRTVEGNLQGETIHVGISDMRLIIDRLTDMYSDRELASIREYSCNALDAHKEAGVIAPIEVNTPGPLAPFLTIRDFGIGLTVQDIREIYSQYGASTKRLSNDQTGAFGLGCKSALAYSDQFTVTSVKDGVRIQVVVSRDPKIGVTMKVVDSSDTSEPNGTTVMIPARSGNSFQKKAQEFFKHWEKGTVLLDGVEPEFMPGAKWVTDSICINEVGGYGYGDSQSTIVMGGVPYPAAIPHGLGHRSYITAFVPIGSVTPKPDREALIDEQDTLSTIRQVTAAFRAGLQAAIVKDIASAENAPEAARKRREWYQKIGGGSMMPAATNIIYKGKLVPDSFKCEETTLLAPRYGHKMNAHNAYRKDDYVPLPNIESAVWVTGFDYASFTATVKKKMLKWCEDKGMDLPPNFVLTVNKPDTTWLSDVTFIDWPTIKSIKLPRNVVNPSTGRIPGSYDLFENGDWNEGVPGDDIDTSSDLFWMEGTRYYQGRETAEYLNTSYPGCTLVMLRAGREGKFERNFPKAQEASKVIQADFEKWKKGLDKDTVKSYILAQNSDSRLLDLDASKVDDPEIKQALTALNKDTSKLEAGIKKWAALNKRWFPEDDYTAPTPLMKYALVPDRYDWHRTFQNHADAIYRYLNCEYKHLKDQA